MIQMTCFLLDCLLKDCSKANDGGGTVKDWQEICFVFAVIWGFGSTLHEDQLIDWRNEFSRFWHNEFKYVRFPSDGNIFEFYIDPSTREFRPWKDLVQTFDLDTDVPLQVILLSKRKIFNVYKNLIFKSTLVYTAETARLRWFLDTLVANRHPVMLIGGAGSGKSVVVADKLSSLTENYCMTKIPFNFYTTSEMLQGVN